MTWLGFAIAVLLLIVILQNFVAAQELHAIYLRIAAFAKKTEEDTKAMADTQADTTAQIQTTISQLMAKATINTDRLASIRDLLHGYRSEVQKFVARAVTASNPNNPDPAALQSALDNLNTLNSELDAQAAAEAVIMNTEAPDTTTQDPLSPDGQAVPPSNQPNPPVAKPVISGVSPSAGLNAGGDSVVISGSGFTGATGVSFDGTDAASFTVTSDTSIAAVTPAAAFPDAHAANVVVTGPNGAASGTFNYEAVIDPATVPPIPAATQAEMNAGTAALSGEPTPATAPSTAGLEDQGSAPPADAAPVDQTPAP